jgi:amphi-Trp domain-containing protein
METILFKSEERKNIQEVADVLRQIADKIEKGEVVLKRGSEEVRLEIPSNVILELKVEEETKKNTKRTLEIEIEWIEGANEEDFGPTVIH